jgi:aminoglycoside phosphotransferase (APT) family kinase protein
MLDDSATLGARLAGEAIASIEAVERGANSRVYRLRTASGRELALKRYPIADARDRLGQEYEALEFLRAAGFTGVPVPVARDPGAAAALYSWLPGRPGGAVRPAGDVLQLVTFLAATHAAARLPEAAGLRPAAEAVTGGDELFLQLEGRLERLGDAAAARPRLAEVLAAIREQVRCAELTRWPRLPQDAQTLSPADIGFHNALRLPDGRLAFVDFEYFGWDDPVKLVADVLWHPGHDLRPDEALEFRSRTAEIYSADRNFEARLAALYPFFGLRWALIVLNDFLPEGRMRRDFAGRSGERLEIEERQLAKARNLVERVRACAS